MKIQNPAPVKGAIPGQAEAKPGGKCFSKVLEKKKQTVETGPEPLPTPEPAPAMPAPVTPSEAPAAIAQPKLVQSLVNEIVVVAGPEKQKVEIQFDSKVLDGLKVSITKQDGQISIDFTARTAEIGALLTGQVSQLNAALVARGVPVANIRVASVERSRRGRESGKSGARPARQGR